MPGSKVAIFPIILGLSVCGVSAGLVYLWYKRREEEARHETESSEPILTKPIEIRVKTDLAPFIVGRGGSTIRDIEEKSGATVYFKEYDDQETLCLIKGTQEQANIAKKIIEEIIETAPLFETEEIWVPHSAGSRIIGRCGEMLIEITRKSNAKIIVDSPVPDTASGAEPGAQKRRIEITGTPQQITAAKELIAEKVKQDADLRKQLDDTLSKREPRGLAAAREEVIPQREKLQSVGTDGTLEVYVSASCNPQQFWLQLVGPQAASLDSLVETMTEYYNNEENRNLHVIHSPQVGQIVAAMYNIDNKWYRAQILAIQPSDFEPCKPVLDLYFVDYGDNSYVSPQEVFELRTDFLTLRFQAIECFLANVSPPSKIGPTGDSAEKWPQASISRFEELTQVANWKKLWSRVVSYKERDDDLNVAGSGVESSSTSRSGREGSPIPGIELYDTRDGRDINIAHELASEGLARLNETSRGSSPGAFGDLGRSKVLGMSDPKIEIDVPHPSVNLNEDKHLAVTDLVNAEKNENIDKPSSEKKKIINETKDFIKGIANEASEKVSDIVSGTKHLAEDLIKDAEHKIEDIIHHNQKKQTKVDDEKVKEVENKPEEESTSVKTAEVTIESKSEEKPDYIFPDTTKREEKKSDKSENVSVLVDEKPKLNIKSEINDTVKQISKLVDSNAEDVKDAVREDIVNLPEELNSSNTSHTISPVPKSPPVDFMPTFTKNNVEDSKPKAKAAAAATFLDFERNGHKENGNAAKNDSQNWTQL